MGAVNLGRVRRALLLVTLLLVLAAPRFLYPCGPFFYSPIFITPHQPERVDAYVAGQLGVPLRTYRGVYLVMAYRYFSGQPLTAAEQKAATEPSPGVSVWWASPTGGETKPWLEARAAVPGLPPSPKFEMWKEIGNYETIVNCTPDAFKTAAQTLLNRVARYGPTNGDVKEWVAGQDRVFVQCSGGNPAAFSRPAAPISPLPEEIGVSAPQWLKEDRAYQIAAATFYAGNFDEAHAKFLAIAADANSPWQSWGRYLAGRSLVRKATLQPEKPDQPYDPKVLAQAETELKQVLADPKLKPVHEAARQVLGYVEFRLHPQEREAELGKVVAKPSGDENFRQDVKDFLLLIGNTDDPESDAGRWINAFKVMGTRNPDEGLYSPSQTKVSAVEEWKKRKTVPWLVLAIADARTSDPNKAELIAAVEKVPADSPAYPTLVYHEARLATNERARRIIDEFLAKQDSKLSLSAKNLFLRERLDAAADFNDFLAHAQRRPAATGAVGYTDEFQDLCNSDDKNKACKRAYFDEQGARTMDLLPVSDWQKAVDDKQFDLKLRQQLALTTWCRAVLTENWTAAEKAARSLKELMPETAKYLDGFLGAKDPAERKFAAVFAMLHWPGIKPSLADLTLRDESLDRLNDLRMNWWCSYGGTDWEKQQQAKRDAAAVEIAARLLTAPEQAEAKKEKTIIDDALNAPNLLEPEVLAWAKSHPQDSRVPEALHYAITAGHLSCSTDNSAGYSKRAFTMLHEKYPNSEWAKRTKYWYK